MALTSDQLAKIGISYAPNFNDEENPTIKIFNNSGVTLREWSVNLYIVDNGGSFHYLEWRDIPLNAVSYTFVLTESERDILRTYITGQTSNATFYLSFTDSSGTIHSKYYTVEVSIKYAKPTMSITVVDTNSDTVSLTGNNSRFIRYFSDAKYSINITPPKKASIVSCSVTNGTTTLSSQNGTFSKIPDPMIQTTVIDSRGFGSVVTTELSMIYYVKLTCHLDAANITGDGKATLNISGMYFNESFGSVNNTLTVYYRKKTEGGSYGSWIAVTPIINKTSYSASIALSDFDYKSSYTFQAKAVDKLMEISSVEKTIRGTPVFDWSKDDFNFNVPVVFQNGFEVNGNVTFKNDTIFENEAEFQQAITVIKGANLEGGAVVSGSGLLLNNTSIFDIAGNTLLRHVANYQSTGIDPDTTLDSMILTHINTPESGAFYYIRTEFYSSRTVASNRMQIAYPYRNSNIIFYRYYYNSSWSSWVRIGSFRYPNLKTNVYTGDFWNDGSDIFMYITEKEVTSVGTNVTIDNIGVSNANIISINGTFKRHTEGTNLPLCFYYSGTNFNLGLVTNDGDIVVRTSAAGIARVIVQYTI